MAKDCINIDDVAISAELSKVKIKTSIEQNEYNPEYKTTGYIGNLFKAIDMVNAKWKEMCDNESRYVDYIKTFPDPTPPKGVISNEDGGFANVRNGANKNSSQIIEKLDQGSKIELLDEYAQDKYLHIRYRNENGEVVDGYVWGKFVDIDDEGELL